MHLFQSTLSNCLSDLAQYGVIVRDLQAFVNTVATGESRCSYHGSEFYLTQSLTYQALATVLSQYLADYRADMSNVQVEIAQQSEYCILNI